MSRDLLYRVLSVAATILLFVAVAAFAIYRVDDWDTWWHLAAGRYIVSQRSIPAYDVFSYTAGHRPWIDLQWGFQVMLFAAYRLGGVSALILLTAVFALIIFGILRRVVHPGLAGTVALILTLLVVYERFTVRPEICSFVLFVTYLALLEAYPANGRLIWMVIPLQVVWVNVHALFVVGLVLVGSYTLGRTIMAWSAEGGGTRQSGLVRLWLVASGAVLACLLNPYGIDGTLFPLKLLTRISTEKDLYRVIGEFASPFSGPMTASLWCYEILIGVTAATFVLRWRRLRLDRLLAWCAFLTLSIMARRNMGFFALAAAPITADGLAGVGHWIAARATVRGFALRVRPAMTAALGMALATLIFLVVTNRFYWLFGHRREFGFGISSIDVPVGAVNFLDTMETTGNIFNDLAVGAYLAWRSGPERKVFIDGRLEVYEPEFFTRYRQCLRDPAEFELVAEAHAIDSVGLYHWSRDRRPLIAHLARSPAWSLVYLDEAGVVFMRKRPENAVAIRQYLTALRHRLEKSPDHTTNGHFDNRWLRSLVRPVQVPYAHLQKGSLLLLLRELPGAVSELEAALRLEPDLHEARVELGHARWRLGQHEAARAEWSRVLAVDPDFSSASLALLLHGGLGD